MEPWQIKELQDEFRLGEHIDDLAYRYGISRRTVSRYLSVRIQRIYVDGWTAWFALSSEAKQPQRLTPWEKA